MTKRTKYEAYRNRNLLRTRLDAFLNSAASRRSTRAARFRSGLDSVAPLCHWISLRRRAVVTRNARHSFQDMPRSRSNLRIESAARARRERGIQPLATIEGKWPRSVSMQLNLTVEAAIYTTLAVVSIGDADRIETERSRRRLVGG